MYDDFYDGISINAQDVASTSDFVLYVKSLARTRGKHFPGTLEEYLRALWPLIVGDQNEPPTWSLFARLLESALTNQPLDFDPDWLNYRDPPTMSARNVIAGNGFENLQKLVLYQIADLRRMKDEGILDKPEAFLFMGVQSPTGHSWYNFHPSVFLSCAVAGLNEFSDETKCDWYDLAILLWLGQIYE